VRDDRRKREDDSRYACMPPNKMGTRSELQSTKHGSVVDSPDESRVVRSGLGEVKTIAMRKNTSASLEGLNTVRLLADPCGVMSGENENENAARAAAALAAVAEKNDDETEPASQEAPQNLRSKADAAVPVVLNTTVASDNLAPEMPPPQNGMPPPQNEKPLGAGGKDAVEDEARRAAEEAVNDDTFDVVMDGEEELSLPS
jgi:hypothetical protein